MELAQIDNNNNVAIAPQVEVENLMCHREIWDVYYFIKKNAETKNFSIFVKLYYYIISIKLTDWSMVILFNYIKSIK